MNFKGMRFRDSLVFCCLLDEDAWSTLSKATHVRHGNDYISPFFQQGRLIGANPQLAASVWRFEFEGAAWSPV
jgi:hypothetical protein